ncbi:hypothetical protein KQI58_07340 [Enterococcus raffinosus]|uniref:hypothetical protein n=1 Tax=Enterococcus raffinosus TaxID=71452 RepID=UPI001C106C6E|nr:hypothetical protein [Enterococcus raffinosus]MBU5360891.1 hypothetical protein [Enterococcus raffinosus]
MRNNEDEKKKESTYELLLRLTQIKEDGILVNVRYDEEVHDILFSWIKEAEKLKRENDKLRKLLHIKITDQVDKRIKHDYEQERSKVNKLEIENKEAQERIEKLEEQLKKYRRNIDLDSQFINTRKQLELKENDTYSSENTNSTDKEIKEFFEEMDKILSDLGEASESLDDTSEDSNKVWPFIYQKQRNKEELTPELKERRREELRGKRGGCQLSDKQIERLLLIYKNKDRVPVTQAISKLAITRRTYYRVINLAYTYEETRKRIRKIADKLGVVLP